MSYEAQAQNNVMMISEIVTSNNNTRDTFARESLIRDALTRDSREGVARDSTTRDAVVTGSENPSFSSQQMQKLQDRMNQLEKAVLGLGKKESYVAAMAVDLEHMMMILIKRLDRDGDGRRVAAF